jgi:hypothetical protein
MQYNALDCIYRVTHQFASIALSLTNQETKLSFDDLSARHPGVTLGVASGYAEAVHVCLERHHTSKVEFKLKDNGRIEEAVAEWKKPDIRTKKAWANNDDATRDGAYAVALAAVEITRGLVAVGRAETRTGADYYLGDSNAVSDDFEASIRLEVSGTDEGGEATISSRLKQKLEQASKQGVLQPACNGVSCWLQSTTNCQRRCEEAMNWSFEHRESERLAAAAHETLQHGNVERAQNLFAQAARAEIRALDYIGPDKPRTLGVTAVSAVSLLYKAGILDAAEKLAHSAAANSAMPSFALVELQALLQTIWHERAHTAVSTSFLPGQLTVSIKGGEIMTGRAPLDLILDKVNIIEKLFYRTAELLDSRPLRKKGRPSREIKEQCNLWILQTPPGSYQFVVALRKPLQVGRFPPDHQKREALTNTLLSIVRAAGEAHDEELRTIVPDDDYREKFLELTYDLSPRDEVFDQIEIRGASDQGSIILSADSRKLISERMRNQTLLSVNANHAGLEVEITLRGVLRAVDLDQDLIEVVVDGDRKQVTGVGRGVDDVIGPMINHEVRVRVRRRRNVLTFIDIEQED